MSGQYEVGQRLSPEAELSQAHSVSRNTLLEAIRMLAAKGLVEVSPRRGTSVRPRREWNALDADILEWTGASTGADSTFMSEVLRLREIVEPAAAHDAALAATPEDLIRIEASLERMQQEADRRDIEGCIEADLAFHMAVAEASQNRFVTSIARSAMHALRANFRALIAVEGNFSGNIPNHHVVQQHIAARHPLAAEEAMKRLLSRAQQDTLALRPEVGATEVRNPEEETK